MGILLSKLKSMGKKGETIVEELNAAAPPVPAEPLFKKRATIDGIPEDAEPAVQEPKLAEVPEVPKVVEPIQIDNKVTLVEPKKVLIVKVPNDEPLRKRETCAGDVCPYQDSESIPKTN